MVEQEEITRAQVERILHSETFRNSEALRRLMKFLCEKSLAGEADQLKEYSVGIDALGKPPTYDPRQDSVVRIQVARLRQKLAEYYRVEGKDDPLIVELPKGRFKISFEPRVMEKEVERAIDSPVPPPQLFPWKTVALTLCVGLLGVLVFAVYTTSQLWRIRSETAGFRASWTPELEELWRPFVESKRPLIVATAAPLFVGFQGDGFYRDLSLNNWDDVLKSDKIRTLRNALHNPDILPRYYYTGSAEVRAAFLLGKLLAINPVNISVARSSQLSWQQLADNNVIAIGGTRFYEELLKGLPVRRQIALEEAGIRNLHPQKGEPEFLSDHYPAINGVAAPQIPDDGEVYAVVTRMPGPLGHSTFDNFAANHSPGSLAAVQWFTQPDLAATLVAKLRKPSGEIPRYFQVVLRVRYQDTVPTEVSYVMHRELQLGTVSAK
jgi:hypothetical protein